MRLRLQQTLTDFQFGVATCGLKTRRPDMAIIKMPEGTVASALFTQNAMSAAPVHVSRQHVANGDIQAVVVNSGNANACTGRQGLRDALEMCRLTAEQLDIEPEQVLVASTGIIGEPLDMEKVRNGIEGAASLGAMDADLATAILTTDSGPKVSHRDVELNGETYTIQAITKGAGMIHPNMATMLSFVLTDAPVTHAALQESLRDSVVTTFNQISVDGDESTNDMVAAFATGDQSIEAGTEAHAVFTEALSDVCQDAARQIVADGEGATRAFEVRVEGTPDEVTARKVARAIASSTLVKSAVHGADPNWGRIGAALGQTYRSFEGSWDLEVESSHGQATLVADSRPQKHDASHIMRAPWITFHVRLPGDGEGRAWGCDLTPEYVNFNAAYRT